MPAAGLSYGVLGDAEDDAGTGQGGTLSLTGMEPGRCLCSLLNAHGMCGVKSLQRRAQILAFSILSLCLTQGKQEQPELWEN